MRRSYWFASAVIAALGLTQACATPIANTIAFGPSSDTAMAVVAGPMGIDPYSIELRQVDLQTGAFGDEIVEVHNAIVGGHRINWNGQIWLSPRELEGGHYAITFVSASTFNGVSTTGLSRCLATGAPVYRFPKGQISIIQVNATLVALQMGKQFSPLAPMEAIMAEFAQARLAFPDLIGEPEPVETEATIAWTPRGRFATLENCRPVSPQFRMIATASHP